MSQLRKDVASFAEAVIPLANATTTTEATYYPHVRSLIASILKHLGLPADVRTNTSERRAGSGVDAPDVAIYDGGGDFVSVCGEVKLPKADLYEMAVSTDRND